MNKKQIKKKVLETIRAYCNAGNKLYLPVPIKSISKSFANIRVIPYSRYMKNHNLTIDEMYNQAGTKDAYTDFDSASNLYIIVYNDMDKSINSTYRYRWNIAHELGHIILNHHKNNNTRLFRNSLSNAEYRQFEEEADWFASYILVPYSVLNETVVSIDSKLIRCYCNVSDEASKYRYRDFQIWNNNTSFYNNYDFELLKLFLHYKKCINCNSLLNDKYQYCHICGRKDKIKTYYKNSIRSERVVKYKMPDNDNGVLKLCLKCENEEILSNADYCHICGSSVVNKCIYEQISVNGFIQCEMAKSNPIPVNARYCPYCSSPTTFNQMLEYWENEKNKTDVPF